MVRESRVKADAVASSLAATAYCGLHSPQMELDPVFTETILLDFNDAPRNDSRKSLWEAMNGI